MTRPLVRKIGHWWRICYHGHPTLYHYASNTTAHDAAQRLAAKENAWR